METKVNPHIFNADKKQGVYDAIYSRRDIRKEFLPDPIPQEMLLKLLDAAHHAGSVGFMQPWSFVVIDDLDIRKEVKASFETEHLRAAQNYEGSQKELYESFKLEGILESPINVCITCDSTRAGKHVIGRNSIPETDVYSTCCAIQNFWLAARAEGIGVGWVSILDNTKLKQLLHLPDSVTPIAYLCVGYVNHFSDQPLLEKAGWRKRLPLEELIHRNKWGNK